MNQIQFETNGLTVLVCKVKKATYTTFIDGDELIVRMGYDFHQEQDEIKLPEGDWKLHAGTDAEITDEQLEAILPTTHKYRRFSHLMEILRSHGIDPNEKWVLLVKPST